MGHVMGHVMGHGACDGAWGMSAVSHWINHAACASPNLPCAWNNGALQSEWPFINMIFME